MIWLRRSRNWAGSAVLRSDSTNALAMFRSPEGADDRTPPARSRSASTSADSRASQASEPGDAILDVMPAMSESSWPGEDTVMGPPLKAS